MQKLAALAVALTLLSGPAFSEGAEEGKSTVEGKKTFRGKDCDKAAEFIKAIEKEAYETNLLITLGDWHQSGACVPADYAKAAKNFLKASERGNRIAFLLLGYAYINGLGVTRHEEEARHLFKRFALTTDYMDEKSRNEYAAEILDARKMPKELKQELDWVQSIKTADAKDQYRIALKLRDGDGLPMNRDVAHSLLLKASIKRLPEAMYELGRGLIDREYAYGSAFRDNIESDGLNYIRDAAKERYVPAEKFLGLYYADDSDMEPNYFWSYVLLLRAKEGGAKGVDDTLRHVEAALSEKERKDAQYKAKTHTFPIPIKRKPTPKEMLERKKRLEEYLKKQKEPVP